MQIMRQEVLLYLISEQAHHQQAPLADDRDETLGNLPLIQAVKSMMKSAYSEDKYKITDYPQSARDRDRDERDDER